MCGALRGLAHASVKKSISLSGKQDLCYCAFKSFQRSRRSRERAGGLGQALERKVWKPSLLIWIYCKALKFHKTAKQSCRVEAGRGALRLCQSPVSLPRSSNRTCGFPASGFPTDFMAGPRRRPRDSGRVGRLGISRGFLPRKTVVFLVRAPCAVWRGSRGRVR